MMSSSSANATTSPSGDETGKRLFLGNRIAE
jgi:hypothetical protein